MSSSLSTRLCPSIEVPPTLEMKQLPDHLKYAFLGEFSFLPIIILSLLSCFQEEKLLRVLREHRVTIDWTIADINGISPSNCMHKNLLEDGHKPSVKHECHLNLIMKDVVKKEIIMWLDRDIIYPIIESQ